MDPSSWSFMILLFEQSQEAVQSTKTAGPLQLQSNLLSAPLWAWAVKWSTGCSRKACLILALLCLCMAQLAMTMGKKKMEWKLVFATFYVLRGLSELNCIKTSLQNETANWAKIVLIDIMSSWRLELSLHLSRSFSLSLFPYTNPLRSYILFINHGNVFISLSIVRNKAYDITGLDFKLIISAPTPIQVFDYSHNLLLATL